MGFEAPAFIGVIIGITNIIPFFGPFIGAIPCGLLLLLENPMHCLYFIIFIFVLQQLDGNVIGPRFLVIRQAFQASGYYFPFFYLEECGELSVWLSEYRYLRLFMTL